MRAILRTVILGALLLLPQTAHAGAVSASSYSAQAAVVAQEPAVEVPEPAEEDEDNPWTTRFLAPTVLAVAAVVLALVVIGYFVRIRGRYQVVE